MILRHSVVQYRNMSSSSKRLRCSFPGGLFKDGIAKSIWADVASVSGTCGDVFRHLVKLMQPGRCPELSVSIKNASVPPSEPASLLRDGDHLHFVLAPTNSTPQGVIAAASGGVKKTRRGKRGGGTRLRKVNNDEPRLYTTAAEPLVVVAKGPSATLGGNKRRREEATATSDFGGETREATALTRSREHSVPLNAAVCAPVTSQPRAALSASEEGTAAVCSVRISDDAWEPLLPGMPPAVGDILEFRELRFDEDAMAPALSAPQLARVELVILGSPGSIKLQMLFVRRDREGGTATVLRRPAGALSSEPLLVELDSLVEVRRQQRASHVIADVRASEPPRKLDDPAATASNPPVSTVETRGGIGGGSGQDNAAPWRPREDAPVPLPPQPEDAPPQAASGEPIATASRPPTAAPIPAAAAARHPSGAGSRDSKRQSNSRAGARQMAVGQLFARLTAGAAIGGEATSAAAASEPVPHAGEP